MFTTSWSTMMSTITPVPLITTICNNVKAKTTIYPTVTVTTTSMAARPTVKVTKTSTFIHTSVHVNTITHLPASATTSVCQWTTQTALTTPVTTVTIPTTMARKTSTQIEAVLFLTTVYDRTPTLCPLSVAVNAAVSTSVPRVKRSMPF